MFINLFIYLVWDYKNKRIFFIRKFYIEIVVLMFLFLIFYWLGFLDCYLLIYGLIGFVYGFFVFDNVIWCYDFSCCIFDKVMEMVCVKMNYFIFCMLVFYVKNILLICFCFCMLGILGILVYVGFD